MILADKIIDLRKKQGLSQEELAQKIGVSRQSVSKWEGAQSTPDMNKIPALSEVFGVSTDYLLKDDIASPGEAPLQGSDPALSADEERLRPVSMEEANRFLENNEKNAGTVALGVLYGVVAVPLYNAYRRRG